MLLRVHLYLGTKDRLLSLTEECRQYLDTGTRVQDHLAAVGCLTQCWKLFQQLTMACSPVSFSSTSSSFPHLHYVITTRINWLRSRLKELLLPKLLACLKGRL